MGGTTGKVMVVDRGPGRYPASSGPLFEEVVRGFDPTWSVSW
jgi:hypothetical protein